MARDAVAGEGGLTTRWFLGTLAAVQAAFVAADVLHRRLERRRADDGLHADTAVFLCAVVCTFLALQYAGLALVPHVDAIVDAVRAGVGNGGTAAAAAPRTLSPGGTAALSVALFYVAGFWDYVWHRWFSHSRWLWFTHENHHLPSHVSAAMPGMVARPFAVLVTVPVVGATAASTYLALRLCGVALPGWGVFQLPLLACSVVLTASHSSLLRRWWGLHRAARWALVTTPQEHVLHHTVDLRGNYGNFTTLWDRLFGTYLDPERPEHRGRRLGLAYDQDFLGTLTFGRVKLPRSWRRRFRVHEYCNLDP